MQVENNSDSSSSSSKRSLFAFMLIYYHGMAICERTNAPPQVSVIECWSSSFCWRCARPTGSVCRWDSKYIYGCNRIFSAHLIRWAWTDGTCKLLQFCTSTSCLCVLAWWWRCAMANDSPGPIRIQHFQHSIFNVIHCSCILLCRKIAIWMPFWLVDAGCSVA